MDYSDITKLVIIKLEEYSAYLTRDGNSLNGVVLSGGDDIDSLKPIYSYIDAHLADAADEVLMAAPLNRLIPTECSLSRARDDGRIMLPPDFLRLHTLRMWDWWRPVHKTITMDDPLYALQHNRYTMGTPQKPVVAYSGDRYLRIHEGDYDNIRYEYSYVAGKYTNGFVITNSGNCYLCSTDEEINTPYLEIYSVSGTNYSIKELLYIPHFRDTLEYNTEVAEAIALNCAKKIFEVYGQTERINMVSAELQSVISNMSL